MNKILKQALKTAKTQSELARLLGTDRQFVNQWVKNKRPIPDSFLIMMKALIDE